MKYIKIQPAKEELEQKIQTFLCTESGCQGQFSSAVALNFHLVKRHGCILALDDNFEDKQCPTFYYCPEPECPYTLNRNIGKNLKFFTELRQLKQHYLKMHTEKTHFCSTCKKPFASASLKYRHERTCRFKVFCGICGWNFNSNEALLNHVRRKGHKFTSSAYEALDETERSMLDREIKKQQRTSKRNSQKDEPKRASTRSQSTQTVGEEKPKTSTKACQTNKEPPLKRKKLSSIPCQTAEKGIIPAATTSSKEVTILEETSGVDNSCQTSTWNLFFDDSNAFDSGLCHIETQTDASNTIVTSQPGASLVDFSSQYADPLLYSHTWTQTCDQLLTELGIQTQTAHTQIDAGLEEFLVSTETQTAFGRDFANAASTQTTTTLLDFFTEEISFTTSETQT